VGALLLWDKSVLTAAYMIDGAAGFESEMEELSEFEDEAAGPEN
jgi:hypothetical protein